MKLKKELFFFQYIKKWKAAAAEDKKRRRVSIESKIRKNKWVKMSDRRPPLSKLEKQCVIINFKFYLS